MVLSQWELYDFADFVIPTLEPCVNLLGDESSPPGTHPHTYLGGFPSLPTQIAWPEFDGKQIPFVGQINLADLHEHLADLPKLPVNMLPKTGVLYFFCWCTNDVVDHPVRVIYAETPGNSIRESMESDIRADWQGASIYERFATSFVTVTPTLSQDVLETTALKSGQISQADIDNDCFGDFPYFFSSDIEFELYDETTANTLCWGQIGGYVSQSNLFHLSARDGGYDDGGELWINLLQVPSIGNMLWSDVGYLIFLIRETDLRNGNFEDVRVFLMS